MCVSLRCDHSFSFLNFMNKVHTTCINQIFLWNVNVYLSTWFRELQQEIHKILEILDGINGHRVQTIRRAAPPLLNDQICWSPFLQAFYPISTLTRNKSVIKIMQDFWKYEWNIDTFNVRVCAAAKLAWSQPGSHTLASHTWQQYHINCQWYFVGTQQVRIQL